MYVERADRMYVSAMEAWFDAAMTRYVGVSEVDAFTRRARRVESYVAMVMRLAASNARPPVSLRDLDLLKETGDMARTLVGSIATHQAPIDWAAQLRRAAEAEACGTTVPVLAHVSARPACEPRPLGLVRDSAPAPVCSASPVAVSSHVPACRPVSACSATECSRVDACPDSPAVSESSRHPSRSRHNTIKRAVAYTKRAVSPASPRLRPAAPPPTSPLLSSPRKPLQPSGLPPSLPRMPLQASLSHSLPRALPPQPMLSQALPLHSLPLDSQPLQPSGLPPSPPPMPPQSSPPPSPPQALPLPPLPQQALPLKLSPRPLLMLATLRAVRVHQPFLTRAQGDRTRRTAGQLGGAWRVEACTQLAVATGPGCARCLCDVRHPLRKRHFHADIP